MSCHSRGRQRKRGYLHARHLGRRLNDEAMAREIARDLGVLLPADDEIPTSLSTIDSEATPA